MTLERVSTVGGYPVERIDLINETQCCHSPACERRTRGGSKRIEDRVAGMPRNK